MLWKQIKVCFGFFLSFHPLKDTKQKPTQINRHCTYGHWNCVRCRFRQRKTAKTILFSIKIFKQKKTVIHMLRLKNLWYIRTQLVASMKILNSCETKWFAYVCVFALFFIRSAAARVRTYEKIPRTSVYAWFLIYCLLLLFFSACFNCFDTFNARYHSGYICVRVCIVTNSKLWNLLFRCAHTRFHRPIENRAYIYLLLFVIVCNLWPSNSAVHIKLLTCALFLDVFVFCFSFVFNVCANKQTLHITVPSKIRSN